MVPPLALVFPLAHLPMFHHWRRCSHPQSSNSNEIFVGSPVSLQFYQFVTGFKKTKSFFFSLAYVLCCCWCI